jgi:predicted porin
MKASFFIQEEFETSTGSTETTNSTTSLSQTFITLEGGFGGISVGRMNHATRDVGGVYRFFGDIGRLAGSMNSVNNVSNTVQYRSPSFGGISISAAIGDPGLTAASGAATGVNPQALTTVGISGKLGSVNFGLSQEELKFVGQQASALRGRVDLTTFGANTDLGMARVGFVYADQEVTTAAQAFGGDRNAMGVHVAVPVGKGVSIGGSFTSYEVNLAAGGAKPKADVMTIAGKYDFSKRTALFASFQQVKNTGAANALASASASGINSGSAGSSRGLGVVETTNVTASGLGLTLVHSF